MKEICAEDMELGNLLFGHSRGRYQIERDEWQDTFCSFLENCGFDFYGYNVKPELDNFIQTEYASEERFKQSELTVEDIRKNGTLTKNIDHGDVIYEYYSTEDKTYVIVISPGEDFDNAFDAWFDEFDRYDENEIPDELINSRPDYRDFEKAEEAFLVTCDEVHSHYFDNGVFAIRPYYWGDSEEIASKPNFIYHPENFEISWYKYPLRDSYCNKDISLEHLSEILKKCKESVVEKLNKMMLDDYDERIKTLKDIHDTGDFKPELYQYHNGENTVSVIFKNNGNLKDIELCAIYFDGMFRYFLDKVNETFVEDLRNKEIKRKEEAKVYKNESR